MELTNEEKKKIADAATLMMQTFCEYRMAEDRLSIMSNLSIGLIKVGLDKSATERALLPYFERLRESQKSFFGVLGIGEDNKEFWDWNRQEEEQMREEAIEKEQKQVVP